MNRDDLSLAGKVAVVTGAGRGIGRAIAVGYARAGASVCCTARTQSEIEATRAWIENTGGTAIAIAADVTDPDSLTSVFSMVKDSFGGVDIVVVNAGISRGNRSVADGDSVIWRQTIETNLIGAYNTARAAIPDLLAQGGGKIIFVGSGLGHRGVAGTSAYACSKAGAWMLTRVLAQELLTHNISVNELIPGPVDTGINPQSEVELRAQLGAHEWIKQPEDVVPMALFLATQPDTGPTAQSFSIMRRDC